MIDVIRDAWVVDMDAALAQVYLVWVPFVLGVLPEELVPYMIFTVIRDADCRDEAGPRRGAQ